MKWKTRARLAGISFLTGAFLGMNPALMGAGGSGLAAAHDAAAIAARQHVDAFMGYALDGRVADASVMITDHGWVTPVARQGEDGLIVRTGDGAVLSVRFAEVRDWGFTGADGRLYGNFRARALMTALSPDEAALLAATLSESPLPVDDILSPGERDFLLAAGRGSL